MIHLLTLCIASAEAALRRERRDGRAADARPRRPARAPTPTSRRRHPKGTRRHPA
jgi:hypothetical protein